jgi:hypothetical protein
VMSVFQTPCNYPGVLPATFFSICRRILLDMFGKVVKGISGRVNICSINHLRGTYSWFFMFVNLSPWLLSMMT